MYGGSRLLSLSGFIGQRRAWDHGHTSCTSADYFSKKKRERTHQMCKSHALCKHLLISYTTPCDNTGTSPLSPTPQALTQPLYIARTYSYAYSLYRVGVGFCLSIWTRSLPQKMAGQVGFLLKYSFFSLFLVTCNKLFTLKTELPA